MGSAFFLAAIYSSAIKGNESLPEKALAKEAVLPINNVNPYFCSHPSTSKKITILLKEHTKPYEIGIILL